MYDAFLIGLLIGIVFVGLIGFIVFRSSIDYVKTQTTDLVQSSITRIKQILKSIEGGYGGIQFDDFRPIISPFSNSFSYDTSYLNQLNAFYIRLIMATTNWALDEALYLPPDLVVLDTIHNYAVIIEYKDNIYVVFRGSLYSEDFDKDIEMSQIHPTHLPHGIMFHYGAYDIWRKHIEKPLQNIINKYRNRPFHFLGFSLGSALALLSATLAPKDSQVHVYAMPRCGNHHFVEHMRKNYDLHIYTNRTDLVPTMPTTVYGSMLSNNHYYYCDFPEHNYINVQRGNIIQNHSLDTYLYAFEPKAPECNDLQIVWHI